MPPSKVKPSRRVSPTLAGSGFPDRPAIRMPASAGTYAGFGKWVRSRPYPRDVRFHFLADQIYIDYFRHDLMLCLPTSAFTYEGFRAWAASDAYPERGRVSFLNDEVYIDMSPEEIETHNKVKTAVSSVIGRLIEDLDRGEFFTDGVQVLDDASALDTVPDAAFLSWESSQSGRVRWEPRRDERGQFIQLVGGPDWVLEVVSRWSVQKDTRRLRSQYFQAGVPEYWLIDARGDEIDFRLLVRGRNRYRAVRPHEGWLVSPLFHRAFRLERRRNRMGRWQYTLHVRPV